LCAAAADFAASSPTLAPFDLPFGRVAHAGDVRGQLVLGSLRETSEAKPPRAAFNWELENGVKEVTKTRVAADRELAVVLVGAGAPKATEAVEASVSGGELLPATLVLRTGTTLRIKNSDEIGHELLAKGLDGFSAEASSPGAVRAVHLTQVGHWQIIDKLAAHAQAYLHVLPDVVAIAKVEANGSFAFDDVAPGTYTLKVFRGEREISAKPVEVTSDKPLTLDPLTFADK
jgi:hypothetical protein